jgi:hypothetical protein
MTATNYDRYSRWARIGVWLAILTLLVFIAAIAHAAVSTTETQTVTLLRGGSTLATATSWEDCRAKALADAAKSTATTGTVTYTCQSEKRKVIATYSVTPPPIDPPPVVDPPPSTGSPLGQNDVVLRPTTAKWLKTVTPSKTGDAYNQSQLFPDRNGNKFWFTPAAFALGNGGMQTLTTWANSTDDFGTYGTYRTGPVYAYPSAVWGWRAGEGCLYPPCADRKVSQYTKFEFVWNWKGPAGPNGGADKVDVLGDFYLGPYANPSSDFANKDKAQNIMFVSTIDGGDSGNPENNFSYFGTLYSRGKNIKTPAGKVWHVWQCPTGECQWSTVPTIWVWAGPAIGSNAHTAGAKNSRVDYLDLIHGLENAALVQKDLYIWGNQFGWEVESGGAFSGAVCLSIDGQPSC